MKLPPIEPDLALFLDFDGTLVDLAPRPEDVQVSEGLIASLTRLQEHLDGALAIISGRPIAQIDRFLTPLHLPAAGLHGLEHRFTCNTEIVCDEPCHDIQMLKNILRDSALLDRGVLLEDKGATAALHYRAVPEMEGAVIEAMNDVVADLPSLHVIRGKMVVEAKPYASDKGSAVRAFLEHVPFKGRKPVYIGDDVTDEDGIAAAEAAGGMGIKVGEGETCARYRLANVAEVHEWLAGQMTVSEN